MKSRYIPLEILRKLLNHKSMSTAQIVSECGCGRKAVYNAMNVLECMGFHIIIASGPKGTNLYSLDKRLFGCDE